MLETIPRDMLQPQGTVCQGPVSGCFLVNPSVKLDLAQGRAGQDIAQSGRQKSSIQGPYYPPYTFKGGGLCWAGMWLKLLQVRGEQGREQV